MARCEGVVLVVEDHPLVRIGVLEVIVEAGFETLEANSAVEAIRILEARPDIHLVFTDAEMPGTMDGIELAHYIRNRWPPVKLIVVSGKVVIDPQELPPGARFFPKPYRETSIVEAMLRRAIATRQLSQNTRANSTAQMRTPLKIPVRRVVDFR